MHSPAPYIIAANSVIWVILLLWIFMRQIRPRPVSRHLRGPLLLVAIGIVNFAGSVLPAGPGAGPNPAAVTVTSLSPMGFAVLIVGVLLGVARGVTVRVWSEGATVMRQGTWITVLLWLVAVGVRLAADLTGTIGTSGVGQPAYLFFYLALSLAAQQLTVAERARKV